MNKIHVNFHATEIYADLYQAEKSEIPDKVLIILGGSDGKYELTQKLAELFCNYGVNALALAYWNVEGLPKSIDRIPVELLRKAYTYLLEQGYKKVGVYGVSKGAEYALTAASLLGEITCVVAVSPLDYVVEGLTVNSRLTGTASWSYQGQELPYIPLKMKLFRLMAKCIKERQVDMCFLYEEPLKNAKKEAAIQVENINGSVLFISAQDDRIWTSRSSSERMMQRLKEKHFAYPYEHLNYEYASHLILPIHTGMEKYFTIEKKYPEKCDESRILSWKKTLGWLKNNW